MNNFGSATLDLSGEERGQGTRPPPVADEGSVSWRSGQRNRASEQRDDFFGYHKRTRREVKRSVGGEL
jgi:hypothetical protein